MARGYDLARERENKVNLFGKNLARRAKSNCELSGVSGEKLYIHEVKPVEDEPNYDRCLLLCKTCVDMLERVNKLDENEIRFLSESIWSEVPIVKALSIKIAQIYKEDYSWVEDLLDTLWIEEEVKELVEEIEL